ncbi:TPA: multidrug ABC transporter permease [Candidatus Dependentiae bacterium]|nr:MAG: ABC-2 type transporter [candidate division TM6 bacterium GW2011_GWF2_43_87]HBL98828.1 multidrug ABC transporter permease [Candidatus Dependentiae bacterium]
MALIRDTYILFGHCCKQTLRQPVWIFVMLFQPLCYLFLYAPLLKNMAAGNPHAQDFAIGAFLPGLVAMMAFFGTAYVGFSMVDELRSGIIERLRVTPMSRVALLLAKTLRDSIVLVVQSIVLILVAIPFGFSFNVAHMALAMVVVMLIGVAVAPFSYTIALLLKSEDALAPIINFFSQPMLLLSGVLLPLIFAPAWLKTMSKFNPLTYAVDALRAIFAGNLSDTAVWQGIAILTFIACATFWWGQRTFNKSIS